MLFKTKKVRTETLSEYLSTIRSQLALSIEEAAQKSGVYAKFIEYLETNRFRQLPPDVYVMGFLRQLAVLYAVPAESLIDQFKKERGIAVQVAARDTDKHRLNRFSLRKFILTPKIISLTTASLFISAILVYIGIELISVSNAPSLSIIGPSEGQLVKESFVKIVGRTTPGATLTVNDQNNIFVDEQGSFTTTVPVVSGQPDLIFRVQNKFGKVTMKRIPIVVDLSASLASTSITAPDKPGLSLKLDFLDTVTLSLKVDGIVLPIENVAAGSSKVVNANNEVLVSTTDGGKTVATVNGQKLGVLGKTGQKIIDIPFSVQSASAMANSAAVVHNNPATPN